MDKLPKDGSGWAPRLVCWASVSAVMCLWLAATECRWVPRYVLASPVDVAKAMYRFVFGWGSPGPYAGTFWRHAAATVSRVGMGFLLAAALAIPAGLASGRNRLFSAATDPLVQLFRSVPGIAWLPLAMIWFGIGTSTSVFLIALAAFFPIYVSALHGARMIAPQWVQAAQMLGASRLQVFTRVILPGAFGSVESGLRVGLGISWAYVVLGELTGVNIGLGALLMDARLMGDILMVLVGMFCIALLGRGSDVLLMLLLRRIPGHRK